MSESKVVPSRATQEMMLAGHETYCLEFSKGQDADVIWQRVWKAMIDAAPSADQGGLIKRLMHRVGDYDDPDLCARGKYYTQSDKMVDRRIIAALQSAEAGRKDVERLRVFIEMTESEHKHVPYFHEGKWRFPYLISNDGGFGGGVGEAIFDTFTEAIDAAIAGK